MERYDYREAMKADIRDYIEENEIDIQEYNIEEELDDQLWVEDSVTGNGSGRYTDPWTAEEYLCHNFDLMQEAMKAFECVKIRGAEAMDVTIRCYLLRSCIDEVVEEMREEYDTEAEEAQP